MRAASVSPLDWRLKHKLSGVDVAGEVVVQRFSMQPFGNLSCLTPLPAPSVSSATRTERT